MLLIKLPKSAHTILQLQGITHPQGLTPKQIASLTDLHPRTVRYAIRRLKERNLVDIKPFLGDMRQKRIVLNKIQAKVQGLFFYPGASS